MGKCQIHVIPLSSMVDEKVNISVTGLKEGSKVTLRCHMTERKYQYEAHAYFIANTNGSIPLSHSCSHGGSFKGVRPMGLFSCMQPSPGQRYGIRYTKKDVTKPLIVTLSLHEGHVDTDILQNDAPITSITIQRRYMAENVERIVIRHGNIRGALFKPKGPGPFPGVIDMFGHAAGLLDFRAALLSSHGFAAFALAFYSYDDLPSELVNITLEYCDEAVNWFFNEPYIKPGGIGVLGVSFGGTVALQMASRFPNKVAAAVVICSPIAVIEPPLLYKGKVMPYLEFDKAKAKIMLDGTMYAKGCYKDVRIAPEDTKIKIEKARKILFIVGEDDHNFDGVLHANEAVKRLQAHNRSHNDYDVLKYRGTGHLIEPPYRPITRTSYHKILNILLDWGGNIQDHSKAQEDAWHQLLGYLHLNVGQTKTFLLSAGTSKL